MVAAPERARTQAIEAMLREAGMRSRTVERSACAPELLRTDHVVLLDWPEEQAPGATMPLGELERWDRPTVFLGRGGEHFARVWGLPSPAELAELTDLGPEIERIEPAAGASAVVWRQGHLLYFEAHSSPAEFDEAERRWLAQILAYGSRFVIDRPIVRHPTATGAPLPERECLRRVRIDEAARALGVRVHER
ncbi:MAG: hypothetical protein ABIP94_22365 [Planctomycetota bacterium]